MWQPQGIYNEYVLRSPVLLVGNEAVSGLYNYPSTRIAVIHGKSFQDQELIRRTFKKKEVVFFHRSWNGEPDLMGLRGTLHDLEKYSPDTIIAVGGGSVIDGAKLCRLFYEVPYYIPGVTKLNSGMLKSCFIAIPTTVGTGAEVSSTAVYVENGHKKMVVLHGLQPDVVIYDKRYVEDTPGRLLCASAMDAMSHVVEGYISNIRNSMVEIQAEEALRLLRVELANYLAGREIDFTRLQYAGYLGGIVQNHCIVGAGHAISHQLTGFGYSHGEGVALLLPAVIRMNAREHDVGIRYQKLCCNSGFSDMEELLHFIGDVCDKSGINKRKGDLKSILLSNEANVEFLDNVKGDRAGKGNPVEITDRYIRELIRSI